MVSTPQPTNTPAGKPQQSPAAKQPPNPISRDAWKAGTWPGATIYKVKYNYATSDTLDGIAKKLAGQPTTDATHKKYADTLTWRDLARLNFGTDNPPEVNYYLNTFNGCQHATADHRHYTLDASDPEPWLWIPVAGICSNLPVKIPNKGKPQICMPAPPSEIVRALLEIFDAIDTNGNGFLSKDELWRAVSKPYIRGTYAAAVLAAITGKGYSTFESACNDEIGPETRGISRADLLAFDMLRVIKPGDFNIASVTVNFDLYREKLCKAEWSLFVGMPDPLSVSQGSIGDCWLVAALVGLANRDPAALAGLVRNDDAACGDVFYVKFPAEPEQQVTRPTDSEIMLLSMAEGNGLWLSVLEKAFGQIEFGSLSGLFDRTTVTSVDTGGPVGRGIKLATGHDVDVDELAVTALATTRDKLEKALKAKKVVTASINNDFFTDDREGWPNAHVYTIMGYNRVTDEIQVRNPWGESGPPGKSVQKVPYSIPLKDLDRIFSRLAYEQ